ncbi:MAG: hypothetical protein L0177_19850 [Chloroflexi bacterium]|nr:hypothetical protein [Chloroflexota bacterium]
MSIRLRACPRCLVGAVNNYYGERVCVNCGWSGDITRGESLPALPEGSHHARLQRLYERHRARRPRQMAFEEMAE